MFGLEKLDLENLDDDVEPSRWDDALKAATLFALDPSGLGGVAVAMGPGSVCDLWLESLRAMIEPTAPVKRLPAGIEDDRLLGGIDLVATLKLGRTILQKGVLGEADGGIVVVPMAERLSAGVAARLASVLDRHELTIEREGIGQRIPARIGLVLLDEAASSEERLPTVLLDRLAFHIDLRGIAGRGLSRDSVNGAAAAAARRRLPDIQPPTDDVLEALVATAMSFGIASVVAPMLALRAARASAALAGRSRISREDAILAARLVLAPRATMAPAADDTSDEDQENDEPADIDQPPEDAPEPQPRNESPAEPPAENEANTNPPPEMPSLEEVMLAAVQAALPEGLLQTLANGPLQRGPAIQRQGSGQAQAAVRGRPAGTRMGSLRPGARLALVDTLRAAAPWQPVRRTEARDPSIAARIDVRREDFRIKKYVQRRESTTIFCVDASGSTAFQRLAEAKGAVELLLAEAYVARTYAALVVFRGAGADLVLPPTRSLSRAKSLLATLPGGGGTPLAAGIDLAVATALSERSKGREPLIVMLTDGRANIARDGLPARPRAGEDALASAKLSGAQNLAAVFVDTSPRPRGDAAELAAAMGARYVALPYVEAGAVRDVVVAATAGSRSGPGRAP